MNFLGTSEYKQTMADKVQPNKKIMKKTTETKVETKIETKFETIEMVDDPKESDNSPSQGNLLMGIVNWSGAAWSVV